MANFSVLPGLISVTILAIIALGVVLWSEHAIKKNNAQNKKPHR